MVNYLSAIGFLPQGSVLYLPQDRLNLPLISAAVMILDGLELAVFKSALDFKWCVCVCVWSSIWHDNSLFVLLLFQC